MKKILISLTIAAMLIGTIGYTVLACGPASERRQGPDGRMGMRNGGGNGFAEELKLSFEQQRKLLTIRQQFQKDTQDLRFKLQQKNLELRELWSARTLNQAAIESKAQEVTALRVRLKTQGRAMLDKVKAVLTPEQLKLFDKGAGAHRGDGRFDGGREKGDRGNGMDRAWGMGPDL
jgi:Spy/CpxP family protein refolding chaperone